MPDSLRAAGRRSVGDGRQSAKVADPALSVVLVTPVLCDVVIASRRGGFRSKGGLEFAQSQFDQRCAASSTGSQKGQHDLTRVYCF
jgi:hypothetical protein